MDHQALILGELREFKRATLERLDSLEKRMESLQRAEATRRGRSLGISAVGSILGAAITLLATYFWR